MAPTPATAPMSTPSQTARTSWSVPPRPRRRLALSRTYWNVTADVDATRVDAERYAGRSRPLRVPPYRGGNATACVADAHEGYTSVKATYGRYPGARGFPAPVASGNGPPCPGVP